jgi:hypothetical protein
LQWHPDVDAAGPFPPKLSVESTTTLRYFGQGIGRAFTLDDAASGCSRSSAAISCSASSAVIFPSAGICRCSVPNLASGS